MEGALAGLVVPEASEVTAVALEATAVVVAAPAAARGGWATWEGLEAPVAREAAWPGRRHCTRSHYRRLHTSSALASS